MYILLNILQILVVGCCRWRKKLKKKIYKNKKVTIQQQEEEGEKHLWLKIEQKKKSSSTKNGQKLWCFVDKLIKKGSLNCHWRTLLPFPQKCPILQPIDHKKRGSSKNLPPASRSHHPLQCVASQGILWPSICVPKWGRRYWSRAVWWLQARSPRWEYPSSGRSWKVGQSRCLRGTRASWWAEREVEKYGKT